MFVDCYHSTLRNSLEINNEMVVSNAAMTLWTDLDNKKKYKYTIITN